MRTIIGHASIVCAIILRQPTLVQCDPLIFAVMYACMLAFESIQCQFYKLALCFVH